MSPFEPHTGNTCPVAPETVVAYHCVGGEGQVYTAPAREINWGPGIGPDNFGRVEDYAVVEPVSL